MYCCASANRYRLLSLRYALMWRIASCLSHAVSQQREVVVRFGQVGCLTGTAGLRRRRPYLLVAASFKPIVERSVRPFSKVPFEVAFAAQPTKIICP